MATTTHSEFGAKTEAVEVAKAFADGVHGKTILITGANRGGIGYSTAYALASQSPARIILAGRTPSRVQECIDALKTEFPSVDYRVLKVDLSSQESVHAAAEEVLAWSDVPSIDTVINSAGVMGIEERTLVKEGIEMHFATNHIGHWLLTCLIMPKLIKAAEGKPQGSVRVVNVSSASPMVSALRWSDMNFEKKNKDLPVEEQPNYAYLEPWGYSNPEESTYIPLDGYHRSKVANVLFGIGANRRLFEKHGIFTLAIHPGIINTDLGRNFSEEVVKNIISMAEAGVFTYKTLGGGASTSLVAALDPKLANGVGQTHEDSENYGAYLNDCQISAAANPLAVSSKEAERLWEFSEKIAGQKFSW